MSLLLGALLTTGDNFGGWGRERGLDWWYRIRYHWVVDAALTIRSARQRAGLSLRELAALAHTSHSTLAAYEAGRVVPSVETFERVVVAAGCALDVGLIPLVAPDAERSAELIDVLDLAEQFPTRPRSPLAFPRFPHGD